MKFVKRRRGHSYRHVKRAKRRTNVKANVFMYIDKNGKGGLFLAENNNLWDCNANKIREPVGNEKRGFDGQSYYDLLNNHVLPHISFNHQSFVYQQDNASIHCSQAIKNREFKSVDELLKNSEIEKLIWPANSPDLNPVENVWSMLNRLVRMKLRKMRVQPKNKKQFFQLIQRCFSELNNQHVINTFESFRERCEIVKLDFGNNNNRF